MNSDKQIAQTILSQLGGRQFILMTGAKDFLAGENGYLRFNLPRGAKSGINLVKITLESSDTYTVEFSRFHGLNVRVIETVEDVYCDQLQDVFENNTGLYVTLNARR